MNSNLLALPLKRDGCFVIQARKYYSEELREKLSRGEKLTMAEFKFFTQKTLELKAEAEGLPTATSPNKATDEITSVSPSFLSELTEEPERKPKKKKKSKKQETKEAGKAS